MANQFLVKETMEEMVQMLPTEISDLQGGVYDGVMLLGYYEKEDTPEPIYYYLATIDPGNDDGGSVIELANGSEKLIHTFTEVVDVRYFGAKPDFINASSPYTDNSVMLKNAAEYLNKRIFLNRGIANPPKLLIPRYLDTFTDTSNHINQNTVGYACTENLKFSGSYDIIMDAPIIRVSSPLEENGAFILVGESDNVNRIVNVKRTFKLYARNSGIDWNEENYAGIEVRNQVRCDLTIVESTGFDVGVRFCGYNAAFAYNHVKLYQILNNRLHLDLTSFTPPGISNPGYITSCIFDNYGRIGNDSNAATRAYNRIGIRIGYEGATGYSPESLTFNNGVIEGLIATNTPVGYTALPIQINEGNLNNFLNFRNESNYRTGDDPVFMEVNVGQANFAELTMVVAAGTTGESRFPDTAYLRNLGQERRGNSVVTRRSVAMRESMNRNNIVFQSDLFRNIWCKYDATNANVAGFGGVKLGGDISKALPPNTLGHEFLLDSEGYLVVPNTNGMFIDIDTSIMKRFAVLPFEKNYTDHQCRCYYFCLDESGAKLDPTNTIWGYLSKNVTVFGDKGAADYIAGGLNLSSSVRYITVSAAVKTVRVIIGGWTDTRVKSLTILNVDGEGSTGNISEFNDPYNHAIEPPAAGTYKKGRIVLNDDPATSDSVFGWVAQADGTNDDSIWKTIPIGDKVSSEGVNLSKNDGGQLLGDINKSSITSVIVDPTSVLNYPASNGQAVTFGGSSYEDSFSIFAERSTNQQYLYVQYYDALGAGKGWKSIPFTTIMEHQANSTATQLDDLIQEFNHLLMKLRDSGLMTP